MIFRKVAFRVGNILKATFSRPLSREEVTAYGSDEAKSRGWSPKGMSGAVL